MILYFEGGGWPKRGGVTFLRGGGVHTLVPTMLSSLFHFKDVIPKELQSPHST